MQTLQATREYRYEIAKYTCQELENLPVTSKVDEKECLRAIYKNLELPKVVNIDGISKRYDKLTKQVLIDAIYNGLAEERYNISATTNIDTEKTESIVEAVDDVTETDLGKLAEISFKAITEYA